MTCPACRAETDAGARSCPHCGVELIAPTEVAHAPSAFVVTVDLSPGMLFAGRYRIERALGRGGMGIVYRARDQSLDEVVAIKVLRPDFAQDPAMGKRFKSEIKLARRVRHKNVAAIHDFGEQDGLLFISMELVEGVDLKQLLKAQGAFPPAEAYALALQVTEGLQAVHDAGIIHRDLKTPNIMRDSHGVARLLDFGIAKQHGGDGATTGTGNIVGTPEYMSPEQAQGKKVDYRSDIYALGIVLYEIFTGKVPFRGDTPIATILMHIQDPPTLDGPDAPALPAGLVPVLRKCLAKNPADRYATAHELADALRAARDPARKQAPASTAVLEAPTLRRSAGARRGAPVWAVVAGLGIVCAVAAGWALSSRARSTEPVSATSPAAVPRPTPAVETPSPTPERTLPALMASEDATPRPVAAASAMPPPVVAAAAAVPRRTVSPSPVREARAAPKVPMAVATAAPTPEPARTPTSAPPSTEPGWLQLAVTPWAEVFIDDKRSGDSLVDRISLSAGVHRVRLRHPAYEEIEKKVTIEAGKTEKLRVNFPAEGKRK
jgi:eukaryotic-like serine/threonine-protein kinase